MAYALCFRARSRRNSFSFMVTVLSCMPCTPSHASCTSRTSRTSCTSRNFRALCTSRTFRNPRTFRDPLSSIYTPVGGMLSTLPADMQLHVLCIELPA
ncbi:MAG TPA: hypothetical protein DD727_03245 [Clostridiales bacterium]|nr:hypothetical protein [Clostridiales bacterium]